MFCLTLLIGLFSTTALAKADLIQPGTNSEAFTSFVNNFLQLAKSSDDLKSVCSQAAEECGNYDNVYNSIYPQALKYKAADPDSVAKAVADATFKASDKLTPFNMAKTVAVASARTLENSQLLTTANAAELAKKLADSILDDQRYVEKLPAPHVKALSECCLEVIKDLHASSPKTTADFARNFINGLNDVKNFAFF